MQSSKASCSIPLSPTAGQSVLAATLVEVWVPEKKAWVLAKKSGTLINKKVRITTNML